MSEEQPNVNAGSPETTEMSSSPVPTPAYAPAPSEHSITVQDMNTPEFQQSELGDRYDQAETFAYKANEALELADQGQADRDRIDAERASGVETGPYPEHAKANRIRDSKS